MIQDEKHGAAIDAAGKEHADRGLTVDAVEPFRAFVGEPADIRAADLVQISRKAVSRRSKISREGRVRIGTADQSDFGNVMGRRHARVRGVELIFQSFRLEKIIDLVNSLGDDQAGPLLSFGDKVP